MSLDFNDFLDYQKNPFTKTTYYTSVTDESHVIQSMLGSYMIKLYHAPRETLPSSMIITIGGIPLQEVPSTVTPANMQYRVWYDEDGLGLVNFNANQNGQTVLCSYEHYGTMHSKDSISSSFQIKELVYDSTSWINTIERIGANSYKFRDDITNIEFRYLAGGYLISDILSGGDTWAEIQTNNAQTIYFQNGAYINVGDTISYINNNTANQLNFGVYIRGAGVTTVAINQSFLLSASNVTYLNCKTSHRSSNQTWVAFKGSITASIKNTVKYIGCSMEYTTNTAGTAYMFWNCNNINNANCHNNTFYGVDLINNCNNINNIQIYNNTASNQTRWIVASYSCNNIYIRSNTISNTYYIAQTSYNISNIFVDNETMNNAASGFGGFYQCNNLSNIYYDTIVSSGTLTIINSCTNVINVRVTNSIGTIIRIAYQSQKISNIYSASNTANSASASFGIDTCIGVSFCDVTAPNSGAGAGYGYSNCNRVYGCTGTAKTALFNASYFSTDNSVACAVGNGNG